MSQGGSSYRCGLEPVVGHLGVLDERGVPRAVEGEPAAPGLRFVGYMPLPAQMRHAGLEAKRAAKAVARELRGHGAAAARSAKGQAVAA
jgi:hypothetical protein